MGHPMRRRWTTTKVVRAEGGALRGQGGTLFVDHSFIRCTAHVSLVFGVWVARPSSKSKTTKPVRPGAGRARNAAVESPSDEARRLLGTNIIGICTWRSDGRILDANDAFLDLLGYHCDDLALGRMRVTDLTAPERRERDGDLSVRLRADRRVLPFEWECLRKDGTRVPVLIGAELDEGSSEGIAFVLPLTGRQQAEQELRAREERFRTYLEVAADAIMVHTLEDGAVIEANQGACENLGYTRDELIGMRAGQFDAELDPEAIRSVVERIAAGETVSFETRHRRKDGTVFPVEVSGRHFREGDRWLGISVSRDITERKRTEEARWEAESRFRTFVDHATDAVFVIGNGDEVVDVNRQACESLGYTREELIGRSSHDFDPEVAEERVVLPKIREQINAGEIVSFESTHQRKDGSRFPVEVRVRPFRYGGQRFALCLVRDISERKRSERELRRSQAYLAEAQRVSLTGSFGWSILTGEIVWSEETYRIFAFDPASIATLERIQERIHPEDRDAVAGAIDRAQRDLANFELEHRLLMPDGTVKHLHVVAHVTHEGGAPEYVGAVMDITARKQADEERKAHLWFLESMDQVNRAIQSTNDLEKMMVDVLDVVLTVFGCERAVLGTYTGHPEIQSFRVIARRDRAGFTSKIAAGVEYPIDEVLRALPTALKESGRPLQFPAGSGAALPAGIAERLDLRSLLTMPIHTKLGTTDSFFYFTIIQCSHRRVWSARETRLFEEIGRRLGDSLTILSTLRHLRQSESRLAEAQETAHVGHWEWNPAVDRFTCSEEAARILGIRHEDLPLPSAVVRERIHPEDVPVAAQIREVIDAGRSPDVPECRMVRATGEVRVAQFRLNVVRDESGALLRVSGTIQDVTEQRKAEDSLREAHRELAHIARVTTVSEIGSSIAHEVNQPLAAIIMNANACLSWLDASPPDPAELRETLNDVIHDAERASRIIQRIRLLLRRGEPDRQVLHPNDLILETLAILRTELSQHGVVTQTDLGPDLPEVTGDRVQLQQVLVNLILNARDAMSRVTDRPRHMTVRSMRSRMRDGAVVTLEVQDNGVGLDRQQLSRVFEPFYSSKEGGLGMGLAISRSILAAHGGRLDAAPNEGPGVTFRLTLPVVGLVAEERTS